MRYDSMRNYNVHKNGQAKQKSRENMTRRKDVLKIVKRLVFEHTAESGYSPKIRLLPAIASCRIINESVTYWYRDQGLY